jgi:uncharacterized protein (DUF2141 family)
MKATIRNSLTKKLAFDKKTLNNGTLTVQVKLEAGTYGITLIDDENANGKIDKI